ncbi:MAG: membrane protein insertase YidC [Desulfovibrionaceae bacterium]|nr:membrane protein insertase YidC [Desulfovibrionaceae bacterium]MBF0514318.1 membrane protein insertase YidC [Desulfovibrionaceae bacterium]
MKDNQRIILAVALSLLVLLGWNYFFPSAPAPQAPPASQSETGAIGVSAQGATAQAPDKTPLAELAPAAPAASAGRVVTVTTPLYTAKFNTAGGVISHFELAGFRQSIAPGSPPVDLIGEQAQAKAPMGLIVEGAATWREGQWSDDATDLKLTAGQSGTLIFHGRFGEVLIERELTFASGSYVVEERTKLTGASSAPLILRVAHTLAVSSLSGPDDKYNKTRLAYYAGKELETQDSDDKLKTGLSVDAGVHFGAIESNYFLTALMPSGEGETFKARLEDGVYRLAVEKAGVAVNPGMTAALGAAYYLGPKDPALVAEAPGELKAVINYGFFDFIAKPLLQILHFFHGYVGNYGVAIILLTLLIKILFWPLSYKSYQSMDKMKKIQPMLATIREKYKDDRERMNQEMMQLYKTYKVNPAGGCLPMLLQIPVFFGLYQALLNAIELRHASFITYLPFTDKIWLADLAAKDPYYITPLIMGGTMFLQQKLTPAPGDPTQAKIMLLMPVIFTFMFLNFPAGLVVYWLCNNVFSIAQQSWMMRSSKSKSK